MDTTVVTVVTLVTAAILIPLIVFLIFKYGGVAESLFTSLAFEVIVHTGTMCAEIGDIATDILVLLFASAYCTPSVFFSLLLCVQ